MRGTTLRFGVKVRPGRAAVAVALPVLLLLAACGDSGEGDAPVPPAPIPDTTPAAPTAPAVDIAPAAAVPVPPAAIPANAPEVTAAPATAQGPGPAATATAAVGAAGATPPPAAATVAAAPAPEPVLPANPEAPAAAAVGAPAAAAVGAPATAGVGAPAVAPATPAAPAAVPAVAATSPELVARLAAADPAAGRLVAARCSACHSFEAGGVSGTGPALYDIVGAPVGAVPGFAYSPAFTALAATGATWTYDLLDAFLASPAVTVPGTRMGFGGLSDPDQRANLIAYLRTLSDDPVPLPGDPAADPFRAEIMALGLQPATFTAEQVQIGRDTYARYCSTCHGTSFQGIFYGAEWGQAPALIGDRFERRWFLQSIGAFVTAMEEADIPTYASLHQGLSADRYVDVAAYLLEQYGFRAGEVPLPVEPAALRNIGFWQ